MWRKIRLLLIISGLIAAINANAQFDDPKTLEVGPHVGLSYYMGDINPTKPFAMSDLEYGGVVRFNYNNRWSFRFDYSRAKVRASDKVIGWRPERGLSFTTNINDFSLMAEFNFLEYYTGNPKKNVSPYIFGGISLFHYTPYVDNNVKYDDGRIRFDTTLIFIGYDKKNKWHEENVDYWDTTKFSSSVARFLGERGRPVSISIPFGVGVKFSLSRHMAATVEWRMQKTFTDYLDDVGGIYSDPITYQTDIYKIFEYQPNGDVVQILNEKGELVDKVDVENSYFVRFNLSDPAAEPYICNAYHYEEVPVKITDSDGHEITVTGYELKRNDDETIPGYQKDQQRGNSSFNDWFGMFRVSLTWKFNLPDGRGCNLSKF